MDSYNTILWPRNISIKANLYIWRCLYMYVSNILEKDLWDLTMWISHICLCGKAFGLSWLLEKDPILQLMYKLLLIKGKLINTPNEWELFALLRIYQLHKLLVMWLLENPVTDSVSNLIKTWSQLVPDRRCQRSPSPLTQWHLLWYYYVL